MPAASEALTRARREEIINACAALYETMGFREITLKDIGARTSFARTSIYNYFHTKEEIFLALLQREYERWNAQLDAIAQGGLATLSRTELADALAHTLERRRTMLRLISTNLNEIEENSRLERLVEFKTVYGRSFDAVNACLDRVSPAMAPDERTTFVRLLFPFVFGIYPYAAVTPKQRAAMEQAGLPLDDASVYDIAFSGIQKLLGC